MKEPMGLAPCLILWTLVTSTAALAEIVGAPSAMNTSSPSLDCDCRGRPHTYCTAANVAIPDSGVLTLPIEVPWEYILLDVTVCVEITHPRACDLDLFLTGPRGEAGPVVQLAANRQGDGANYRCTVFEDGAPGQIGDAAPPFSGHFQPVQRLFAFTGENGLGTWTLTIRDQRTGAAGVLDYACIFLIGPSCLPLTGVVIGADADGAVTVHWNAPETSVYRVWSTTNLTNDGDPRFDDPQWQLEIEQEWPWGAAFWRDGDLVSPYKNYVVQRICEFSVPNAIPRDPSGKAGDDKQPAPGR